MKSGAEQLKDWMHRRRFLQREAAEYFGFDVTFVSHLVNGHRTPGLENAIIIERKAGIPVEAWMPNEISETEEPPDDSDRKSLDDKA